MDEKRWQHLIRNLIDRAEKFSDDDVAVRELLGEMRTSLDKFEANEENFQTYLRGLGPGKVPPAATERFETESANLKQDLAEKEKELSQHIRELESASAVARISSESTAISKRVFAISLMSFLALIISICAIVGVGWEMHELMDIVSAQRKDPPPASAQAGAPPPPPATSTPASTPIATAPIVESEPNQPDEPKPEANSGKSANVTQPTSAVSSSVPEPAVATTPVPIPEPMMEPFANDPSSQVPESTDADEASQKASSDAQEKAPDAAESEKSAKSEK